MPRGPYSPPRPTTAVSALASCAVCTCVLHVVSKDRLTVQVELQRPAFRDGMDYEFHPPHTPSALL